LVTPVINFRSEGRRFPKGRCLIPASHFFEFTGSKSPKSKWKFTKADEDWFCFAGLWRPMPDGAGDAFTLLTTEPGPDVAPIHNRQMVTQGRQHRRSDAAGQVCRFGCPAGMNVQKMTR
jgi:putative SOS response-associated peptidase YedK